MTAHLGEFEQLVLLALARLGDEGYGVSVRDEIQQRSGRAATFSSVYAALGRLEEKRLLRSRHGEPTPERGGRRKKYFTLTAAGRTAIAESVLAVRTMARGLGPTLVQP
ncbi:MAG: PadR family transcriptional regulator [Gemmatimonadales bacterium]